MLWGVKGVLKGLSGRGCVKGVCWREGVLQGFTGESVH